MDISLAYQCRQELTDELWSKVCLVRYGDLELEMRRRKPPGLALPRRLLHRIIAARTGSGVSASYHRHFNHNDAILECIYVKETSPTHYIRCRKNATLMRKLRKGASMEVLISQLIGPNCLDKFKEFARVTNFFGTSNANSSSAGRRDSN